MLTRLAPLHALLFAPLLALPGCGSPRDDGSFPPGDGTGGGFGDGSTDGGTTDDGSTDDGNGDSTGTDGGGDGGGDDDGGSTDGPGDTGDDGGTGPGDDGGTDTGDTGTGGDGDDGDDGGGSDGPSPELPDPMGTCPEFTNGTLTFMADGQTREARVWIDEDAAGSMDGPVVFYWYGTGGQPSQAEWALGSGIEQITAAGGIVVAPSHTNGGTFPWLSGGDADLLLADEVIGCAEQEIGIDDRRIHTTGFSAGGIFATRFSFDRSSYLASVSAFSGGTQGSFEDSSNKFAAMIFHGGPSDQVGQNFEQSSEQWHMVLEEAGHFAFLCDHGDGHMIPSGGGEAVVQFFFDHPFGTDPSPYADGFPASVPDYCTLP